MKISDKFGFKCFNEDIKICAKIWVMKKKLKQCLRFNYLYSTQVRFLNKTIIFKLYDLAGKGSICVNVTLINFVKSCHFVASNVYSVVIFELVIIKYLHSKISFESLYNDFARANEQLS